MRPLAIIEADVSVADRLRTAAQLAGYDTEHFHDGASAIEPLLGGRFVLAVVDLELLDVDPYVLCRKLSLVLPVISIAAQCGGEACIRALECGADDCVPRGTSPRELVARIQNVLRRCNVPPPEHWLRACVREMRFRDGAVVHDLTRGEAEILGLLLDRSPAPLTVSQFVEMLQAGRDTIASRIKSLRQKIGAQRLVNRGSLGYQLVV